MNEPLHPSETLFAGHAELRLAPSTLGEILDRTIQIYRSHFLLYLGISLVPTAVVVIPACGIVLLIAWLGSIGAGPAVQGTAGVAGIVMLAVIGLLAAPILIAAYALTLAVMPYAASRTYLGENTTIREAYKSVWRHGWRYCWLLILEGLIVGAAPIAAFFALVAIAAGLTSLAHVSGVGGGALIAVATLLAMVALFVYFFWMLLSLSLAFPACVIEELRATRALKRGFTLGQGTKGRIFLMYFLVAALNWILSLGITVPLTIVMAFIPAASDPASHAGFIMLSVVYGAAFAIQAATRPIIGIALTLFYYDQRIRKEGFDIEWMMQRAGLTAFASALPSPSQSAPPQSLQTSTQIESPPPEKGESI